jgi:hypothetical protein
MGRDILPQQPQSSHDLKLNAEPAYPRRAPYGLTHHKEEPLQRPEHTVTNGGVLQAPPQPSARREQRRGYGRLLPKFNWKVTMT